jgi:hypothetical protein
LQSKEMDLATAQGSLDESKVQAIAARQGETIAKFAGREGAVEVEDLYQCSQFRTAHQGPTSLQNTWPSRLDRVVARIGSGAGAQSHN